MNIIGITGSSGAGKSTICDILKKEYDVRIINADEIARNLSKKGSRYVKEIAEKFGKNILDETGELKRKKLAEMIYGDANKRKTLNQCTFHYICGEIKKQIDKEKDASTIVIDAPLLFESNLHEICDTVIGIISRKDLQIERIVARDNIDYDHAEKRIHAQQTNSFYIANCDEIVENNNDIAHIEQAVKEIAKKYGIHKKLQ